MSLQSKIQSPPVMSGRGAATAASKVKMSYVGEQRRRRAGRRRWRRSFSVPRSGGEAQETRERRKKKALWGKKSKFTPAPVFILRDQGRGDHGSAPLPRPSLREVATWRHRVGRRFL
jgi:hypothetical protein